MVRSQQESRGQGKVDARLGLEIQGIGVRFGGIIALQSLTMSAARGKITGLIGPNGAGKTTTFNVCCGMVREDEGRVLLKGVDISGMRTEERARLGLGRTFQRMEIFHSLTVVENVAMGCEAGIAGSHPLRQLFSRLGDRQTVLESAQGALEFCGIEHLAKVPAGSLSTGQRRLLELARCLAGSFDLLLLDEPSSGLDRSETKELAELLTLLIQNRDIGIVLVEHDMSLVMDVCDYIYVVDFGELIFQGSPQEVTDSPIVRKAYLGTDLA